MFGSFSFRVASVTLCLLVLTAVVHAGKTANPEYAAWSKFKAGAFARYENETVAAGNTTRMTTTMKLVEITADKAVIETTISMEVGGQKMDMPAQNRDVPAAVEAHDAPADPNMPKADVKESEETVEVAGKTFKAKLTESSTRMGDTTSVSRLWTSDEVPGGLLKMEASTEGAMQSTTKQRLVEFSTGG